MYKIFVVEDEPLIRQSLRTAIETSDGPYVFSGEAGDGEMALSMMIDLQPDILITDIKMPFMDGLELARLATENMPWLKTIIVSGHDEFGYAQQAISIGVDQYLLKPIRQKELMDAVDASVARIEAERRRSGTPGRYDERNVQAALFRQLMHHLLFGDTGAAQILEEAKALDVNLMRSVHRVVLIQLGTTDAETLKSARKALLARLARDIPSPGIFVVPHQLTLLVSADNAADLSEQTYTTLRILQHELAGAGVETVTVVSEPTERLSAVSEAYARLDSMVRLAGHLYAGQIVDLADRTQVPAVCDPGTGSFASKYAKRLQHADENSAAEIIHEYLATVDSAVLASRIGRYQILLDIFSTCADTLAGSEENETGVPGVLGSVLDLVEASETEGSFEEQCASLARKTAAARRSSAGISARGGVIQQAVEFIEENYNNPDISLHLVSAHVGFSPAHFSMVFSQKMGRTFIDYLTSVRIEKAKELLTGTDRKLGAIAMEVGYNEPNYFSYVFKKREGVSPKEYRARATEMHV